MKAPNFFIVFALIFSLAARGQGAYIPNQYTGSTASIAQYLRSEYKSDEAIARAAYNWVTQNLRYDKDSMYYFNWSAGYEEQVAATLRRRRGVCENYAVLFTDILKKTGIPAFVIHGYTRQRGAAPTNGHAWATALVDGDWRLFDPTWDAGGGTRQFMISPGEFINSHMPYDPLWQLLPHPYNHREYKRNLRPSSEKLPPQNVKDSLIAFIQLDSLGRLQATGRRMLKAGIEDQDLRLWYAYNSMKIGLIKEVGYQYNYEEAIAHLNKAVVNLNRFINLRNNQAKPDEEMTALLNGADDHFKKAAENFKKLKAEPDNFQFDPTWLEDSLQKLKQKIADQRQYLKQE